MNIQKLIIAALTATVLPTSLNAQQTFNEMMYSKEKTMFILNAPTAQKSSVTLRLYKQGQGGKAYKTLKMKKLGDERWETTVKGDLKGKFYTFDIGKGETPGTFAKAVGVNGNRGAIVDLYDTDPSGWDKDVRPALKSPADLVVYELHVRDFSISPTSGLKYKGKYLALTEPKAIEYLKNLGINAIHFQPVFDFASIDETRLDKPQFNWGYDPKNYNVPEGSYATDPYSPATRIKEFKEMVMALHKAGIRVIFDAVYNHTFDINGSNFQRTYPDYYYRKTKDGKYSDGSGCGNETASEKPLMRQFMLESVKYWIDEYHIDGFRFDLMGVHDIETMQAIREMVNRIDPSIYIYGEGWSAGSCAYPTEKLAVKANTQQLKDSVRVFRPADADETTVCWKLAMENVETPTALIFSRQGIAKLPEGNDYEQAAKGAYIVAGSDENPDVILVASGSEVSTLEAGCEALRADGIKVRVVSAPSEGLFRGQSKEYQESVLPKNAKIFGMTAGLPVTLQGLVGANGKVWGMESFGFSAPYKVLDEKLGYTGENVYKQVKAFLAEA